ncbi:hypothetical protein FOPE_06545 [Fonsecaea pedrosoi]|nr:hypothetical protein FOPE_06545 [Fonsecaea pedrosoi]
MLSVYTESTSSILYIPGPSDSIGLPNLSEATEFPDYIRPESGILTRSAFVMTCRLTEIMARILTMRDQKLAPFSYVTVIDIRDAIHKWDHDFAILLESADAILEPHMSLVFNALRLLRNTLVIQLYQLDWRHNLSWGWLGSGRELVAILETEEAARNIADLAQTLLCHLNKESILLTM